MNISALSGVLESHVSRITAALPVAVMAVALYGCGSEPGSRSMQFALQPTAAGAIVDESTGGGGGGDPEAPSVGSQAGTIVTSGVTATSGGRIVSGRHTLTIPPGAVDTDVQVTLIDMTGVQGYPCVQILPEGLQFKKKAQLTSEVSDLQSPLSSRMYRVHMIPHNRVVWSPAGSSVSPEGTGIRASISLAGMFATTAR